ncbi:MAG TPA: hypothetical protein VEL74_08650 [Thermoanaerobaculia bacterium]|nr:hypothetical protein [Thermoanaerobaculia bacterium]
MKAKLIFMLALVALTLSLQPVQSQTSCSAFCSKVRCIGGYICGPYVNSSGQTVCGCHPR